MGAAASVPRKGGLTDSEIAEVVGLTVLNIFTNYFNTAFQVDIHLPHPQRVARRLRKFKLV